MQDKFTELKDIKLKDGFINRYKCLCGKDYDKFIDISLRYLRRSIRVNTLKISVEKLKERLQDEWELTQIPWCEEGFWIKHKNEERRDIGNLIEHQLGYFHVQEAASMLPPLVLDAKPSELILDMCAAPGSKTTQIAIKMKNTGLLIANDYKGMRVRPLGINLQRAGLTNTMITLMEGQRFKGFQFDRILVDAPCSGTGTIRKSLKTIRMWNPNMIKRLSITQKQLLESAYNNAKKGGTIVYSTCSLEPHEDEAVVSWFLDNFDVKIQEIKLDIKRSPPVLEFEGIKFNPDVKKSLRIWPQDNDTEGFFVAKFKKN
jgi:NOL1/NOP2/sun family putative RNA methylase